MNYIKKKLRTVTNGEESVDILLMDDGRIMVEDEYVLCRIDDENYEDKIDEFAEEWRETHWNISDWADYYGCDENQVEDCMDDDLGYWD